MKSIQKTTERDYHDTMEYRDNIEYRDILTRDSRHQ